MTRGSPASASGSSSDGSPRIRWWPLGILLLLAAARLVQIWWFRDYERQSKFETTGRLLGFALPGILFWFLFLSRLRLATRLKGVAILAVVGAVAMGGFRRRGIDGDGLPMVELRWSRRPSATSDALPGDAGSGPSKTAESVDFPQFQGPARNAVLAGTRLATNWVRTPPTLLWRQPVGEGWSGFSVAAGRAFSLEQEGGNEVVFALDLTTGRRLWSSPYPARFSNSDAGNGPRSVPTVSEGRVYTAGASGVVRCQDALSGRTLWQTDLVQDLGGRIPEWGYSASPLVHRGRVWVPCGGAGRSLVALDAQTGRFRQGGGDSPTAYSSPVVATLGGREQILCLNGNGLAGHDPEDGHLLWEQPIPPAAHVATPAVPTPDRVAVSVGYGRGTFMIQVGRNGDGGWTNGVVWKSTRLKSKFANTIPAGNTLFGLDDGALVALDISTGAFRWKETRYGHGQLLWVDGLLLVGAENGEVALVEALPTGMRELTRFRALAEKTWNPPALAGNLLLVRNDREAACFRMPQR